MNMYEAWNRALEKTEIIRTRVKSLLTFKDTHVPYILLSESLISKRDTVIRRGEVVVEKPSLILPSNMPQFDGFEFGDNYQGDEDAFFNFLLVRGVSITSLKYNNKTYSVDMFEGGLSEAIKHHQNLLERKEDVNTGLITAPSDCWQFSTLIFICSQIAKNSDTDVKHLIEELKKRSKLE